MPIPAPVRPVEPSYIRINHLLHLTITVLTCGLWSLVWAMLGLLASLDNSTLRLEYQKTVQAYDVAYAEWYHYQSGQP